jgi:tRNA(Ile)-lysidine synthase
VLPPLQTFIKEHQLTNQKVLLTVSGGKDSVVLFDLFLKAKLNFGVAHCNFQLRGEESDGDEQFVSQLADNQGVNFHSIHFETKKYASEQSISTQMAARNLRYEWFEKLRVEFGYDYIATAHHLNDNIETILLNLVKGTGIAGLRGIQAINGHIIRPLLFVTREEIDNYIIENRLKWREDSSNASTDYQRNLLRHEVIPILKKINPNLEETFSRNIERFKDLEVSFQKNLSYFKAAVLREENGIAYIKIENLKYWQSATYLLEELLKEYGFNFQQVKEIEKSLTKHSGRQFHSATHILIKDREDLIISPSQSNRRTASPKGRASFDDEVLIEKGVESIKFEGLELHLIPTLLLEGEGLFNSPPPQKRRLSNNLPLLKGEGRGEVFDLNKLTFPLRIRRWQEGDWFVPLGMKGKKKISDFLIDKKIPLHLKKVIFVLLSGDDIIWVIGHRIDDRYKLTDSTKRMLEIRIR